MHPFRRRAHPSSRRPRVRRAGVASLIAVAAASAVGLATTPPEALAAPAASSAPGSPDAPAPTTPPSTGPPPTYGRPDLIDRAAAVVAPQLEISPALAGVPVASTEVSRVRSAMEAAADEADRAAAAEREGQREREFLAGVQVDLLAERAALETRRAEALDRARAERAAAAEQGALADEASAFIQDLVTASYVAAGEPQSPLASESVSDSSRRHTYSVNLFEIKQGERKGYRAAQAAHRLLAARADGDASTAARAITDTERALLDNAEAARAADGRIAQARQLQVTLADQRVRLDAELADARRLARVDGVDFPLIVLDAFWKASQYAAVEFPACRLDWSLLAGISRVESVHGTFGTSVVDPAGQVTPPIIGVPLNGDGFALIFDSDGGEFDYDSVYDRAVGPMQFIPTSWRIYARDGNGDARLDPNNYYDATVAAARHLCLGGADTSTAEGRRTAVFSYNHDESYVSLVSSYADGYAAKLTIGP